MGSLSGSNKTLETIWFSVLAVLSLVCFPLGVRQGRRFPQILVTKLMPVLCVLLAYENIVLALTDGGLMKDSLFSKIGNTSRAAVIPLFLVIMFEVAYAVHKRRSVKFCGIVFDQGHRRSVEPCSWFLRNFVRIVAVLIFVVGIIVNNSKILGDDDKTGETGLIDVANASDHLLLALLPATGMAVIALYMAICICKYGNNASIVVQSSVCNGWMFPFLGTLALLAGQVPSEEWHYRVANETGQVLLLLSLIAIGREIGMEVQAADDFSSFLQKENELEMGGEARATMTPAIEHPPCSNLEGQESEPRDVMVRTFGVEEETGDERKNGAAAQERTRHDYPAIDEGALGEHVDRNFDDVTRPMERQTMRAGIGGGAGQVRQRPGLFNKKGVSLLDDRGENSPRLSENEAECDDFVRDTRPPEAGTDLIVTPSPRSPRLR